VTARAEAADVRGAGPVPLHRNRDYTVLWSGQLLSELAAEMVMVGFPLLVLAMHGSAVQVGMVTSVLATAHLLATLPAGAIADRWDRRRLMLLCQGVRVTAVISLAAALAFGRYSFGLLVVIAIVEGLFGAMFDPAEHAALPQVVPESQLAAAVARNAARPFVATLLGPAAVGLLFRAHPMNPFVANAVMLALSFAALLFLRLPRRVEASADDTDDTGGIRAEVVATARWIIRNTVIRTTLVWMVFANLVFSALVVVILVRSGEDNVSTGELGLMMSCFGAGGLLGALLAARLHAALPAPVILLGFSWVLAAATGLMAIVPSGLPLGVLLGAAALLAPVANTTVLTFQMVTTPDALRGKVSGIAGLCSGVAGALGPMIGGLVVARTGAGVSGVLICAAGLTLVAIGTTLSPTLRRFPTLRGETGAEPVS
jgi:MFS family permease